MKTPEVTICVLTYGDYTSLVRRTIESIRAHCPRSAYRLIVGANAVSDESAAYLDRLRAAGAIDELIHSATNLNKCPMMRRMFQCVNTEFIWWFDDDSYVTAPGVLEDWLAAAKAAPAGKHKAKKAKDEKAKKPEAGGSARNWGRAVLPTHTRPCSFIPLRPPRVPGHAVRK